MMKIFKRITAYTLAGAIVAGSFGGYSQVNAKEQNELYNKSESIDYIDTTEYTLDNMTEVVKNIVYSSDATPYCLVTNDIDTDNSVTVKNTDGSLTTHIFPYDVKENDGGHVRFIGKKIKHKKSDGYDYVDDSGDIVRRFSEKAENGVKLEKK